MRRWRRSSTRVRLLTGVAALLAACLLAPTAQAASPQSDVEAADQQVQAAQAALARGDVQGARAAYAAFDAGWPGIEDGVRAADRPSYRAIEGAMREVQVRLMKA